MAIVKKNFRFSRFESDFSPGSRDSLLSDDEGTRSSASKSESDGDSESDVDSGAASDDFELSELGEVGGEFCQLGTQRFSTPFDLYGLPDLCEILSVDSWNNCLTEDDRLTLAEFLPDMDQEAFIRTLKELFSGANFHFGSPLTELFNRLRGGLCEPRVAFYQQGLKFLEKRRHYHLLRKYQNSMVSSLIQIKGSWESYPGYSIAERLRILTVMGTKRGLKKHGKNAEFSSEAYSSEKEESSEEVWSKKLKDIRIGSKPNSQSVCPLKPSLPAEPAKHGKHNPKGILKVGTLKSSKNLAVNHGSFQMKSRETMGLPWKDQVVGHNLGGGRLSRNQFPDDNSAEEHDSDMSFGKNQNMDRVQSLKHRKKQKFPKEETESYMELPFSDKNDGLYSHGKKNAKQVVGLEMFTGKPINDTTAFNYRSHNTGKKVKHKDNFQRSITENWMNHPKVKGSQGDRSAGTQRCRQSQTREDSFALDHSGKFDDWSAKGKKWKTGEELKTAKRNADSHSKMRSYKAFSPQVSDTHFHSDHGTKKSLEKMAMKYEQNGEMNTEHLRYSSPFAQKEETESDSSEQDVDGDIMSSIRKSRNSSGTLSASLRPCDDVKKASKFVKKNEMEHSQGLGEQLHIPEIEIFNSKGKQKGRVKEPNYYANGNSEDKYYPALAKLGEDKKQTRLGKNGHVYAVSGERSHPLLPKTFSTEKRRKGKLDLEYSASLSNYAEKQDLHLTNHGVDDLVHPNKPGKTFQNPQAHITETEDHENFKATLVGCNSVTRKRKGKSDATYFETQDESVHLHCNSHQPIDDLGFTKKKGKKKVEADTGPEAMVTADAIISEVMADPDPETKLPKKPFPLITPTVHTGFSFSIIHLLSAVRMAMISPNTDDILEKSDQRLNLKLESTSRVPTSHENLDVNINTTEQIGHSFPSLTVQEIVNRVRSNPGDPCILETQEPLQDLIRGVLRIFSSKTAPLGAKGWKALVLYEKGTKSWTWVGPFISCMLDTDQIGEEMTSPTAWGIPHKMLVKLVDAFANWLKSGQETLQQIGSLPAPPVTLMPVVDEKERFRDLRAQKSLTTISPSFDEVRAYFRREEILRYSVPDRAFSYTAADGRKSIVAPLRRCGGKPTSKARDHFMLKPDRPPHVTILCLVRDAAARLPGSIGTRADVCTLLRDSQYIVEDVSDAQVNQVVSGALDRLHYERDPCVQFDGERKLWVYLHRDREEEDFEDDGTSSTKKWKRPRKDATEHVDTEPGNDLGFPGPGGSDVGYDTEFNVGSSSIYQPEKAELEYNDLRQDLNGNMDLLVDSSQGDHLMGMEILDLNQLQDRKMICQENSANEEFDDGGFGRERSVRLLNTRFNVKNG